MLLFPRGLQMIALVGTFGLPFNVLGQDRPLPTPRAVKPAEAPAPLDALQQILELQKELETANKTNDPQKMLEVIARLQKMMQVEPGPNFQFQVLPLALPVPAARAEALPKSDLRQQYEKQLKEFEESIAKLKDDAEARKAIETARDEYKKAMEPELKKADAERPVPRPLPAPDFPRRIEIQPLQPFPAIDFGARNLRGLGTQPRLGVQLEKPAPVLAEQLDLPANVGLVLTDILRGLPAEKAGLKKNDVLLKWAGKDVPSDVEAFQTMIASAKAGEKVEAVILRKGKKETISGIELPEARRPDAVTFNQMQVQINGTVGEIQATAAGVKYEISIEMEGRKPQPSKIVITDGEEKSKYDSVEKVPEKYRPSVEKLLGRIRGFE